MLELLNLDIAPEAIGSPEVKGTSILTLRTYIKAEHAEHEAAILAALPDDLRSICEGAVLASGWYPQPAYTALIEATARTVNPENPKRVAFDWGCWQVREDMGRGIYKAFLNFISPTIALRLAGKLWGLYNRTGQLRVQRVEEKKARILIDGFHGRSHLHWEALHGFCHQLAALSGAESHESCVLAGGEDGDNYVAWEIEWR